MTTTVDSRSSATVEYLVDESVANRERAQRRVEGEIAEAAGILNAAHGRLVRAVAEVLESELWTGYGIRSVEHWLTLQVGVSRAHAEHLVKVARRSHDLPVTVDSLASGAMTLDQASVVAAKVPAHYDAEVAGLAARATVPQLWTLIGKYQFSSAPSDPEPDGSGNGEADVAAEQQDNGISTTEDGATAGAAAAAACAGPVGRTTDATG